MANSFTDKYKKRQPAAGDLNWDDEINQNQTIDDVIGAARDQNNRVIWGLAATDGGGLTVDYAAGRVEVGGSIFEISASTKTAIDDTSARSVNYLYVDSSGVVQISQTAPTGVYAPIAIVDVNSGAIDRIGDFRQQPSGLLADETLAEINKIIDTTADIVDVFLYDTSKDSDGGAWRERTEHTSWYNETLDTATRGSTRKFPAIVFIVAETETVTIYDATDVQLPMWMVFIRAGTGEVPTTNNMVGNVASTLISLSSITMLNGILPVGITKTNDTNGGSLCVIEFVSDSAIQYTSFLVASGDYLGNIEQRNDGLGNSKDGSTIVDSDINDTGITVLPGAPTDPATGLPVPTIAAATNSGVSVITNGGDIWDITNPPAAGKVDFDKNTVIIGKSGGGGIYTYDIPTADTATPRKEYSAGTIPATLTQTPVGLAQYASGGSSGITHIKEDQTTPADGMVNYMTKDYQSGWMQGDIRRAFLANSKTVDRSVKGATLVENGTITESVVATGAELKKYSGFSGSNYFSEAHSADLDFGTGDFYTCGWLNEAANSAIEMILERDSVATAQRITVQVNANGTLSFTCDDNTTVRTATTTIAFDTGVDAFIFCTYSAGTLTIYVDAVVKGTATGAALLTLSNAAAVLRFGLDVQDSNPLTHGSLALWRIGAGAPTAEQIKHIYETEKHLFQENADCTLSGTSDAVAALAYDDVNDLVYVGTGDGVSVFSGLQRVDYIDTTGIPTSDAVNSLSASGGAYMIGNAAEAIGYIPAANLREEITRQEQAGEVLELTWFTGDTSETDFVMPAGWKPKFVYEAGLLVKEGSSEEYTVTFDGFLYTVVFASAPAAVDIGVMGVKS